MLVRSIGIALLMLAAAPAVFVSQLYAPAPFWAVAVLVILFSPLISFVESERLRQSIIFLSPLLILLNFAFLTFAGGRFSEGIFYLLGLYAYLSVIIFLVVRISRALRGSNAV